VDLGDRDVYIIAESGFEAEHTQVTGIDQQSEQINILIRNAGPLRPVPTTTRHAKGEHHLTAAILLLDPQDRLAHQHAIA
jgi:hypothetical protein